MHILLEQLWQVMVTQTLKFSARAYLTYRPRHPALKLGPATLFKIDVLWYLTAYFKPSHYESIAANRWNGPVIVVPSQISDPLSQSTCISNHLMYALTTIQGGGWHLQPATCNCNL